MQYTVSGFEPITTIPGLPPKHRKLSPNTFSQNYGLIQLLRNTFLRLKFKTQTRQSMSMMGQLQIKFIRKTIVQTATIPNASIKELINNCNRF